MLLSLVFLPASASAQVVLPALLGPHAVHEIYNVELVDESRIDPFAPSNLGPQPRRIMVSVFQPVTGLCSNSTVIPYMPSVVASYYDEVAMIPAFNGSRIHDSCQSSHCRVKESPLLLFSTGSGASRFIYSALAQAVASSGYTVITVDHTYDAPLVQFTNGSIAYRNRPGEDNPNGTDTTPLYEQDLEVRTADLEFVLNSIEAGNLTELGYIDTKRVGSYGHSLGGATAVSALINDTRLVGGIDWDGAIEGPLLSEGTDKPFLIIASQFNNQSSVSGWSEVWSHLRGWRLQLQITDFTHYHFTDAPLLTKVYNVEVPALLGPNAPDGGKAFKTVWAYTTAFFDFILKDASEGLLKGPSSKFPDVQFVNRTGTSVL